LCQWYQNPSISNEMAMVWSAYIPVLIYSKITAESNRAWWIYIFLTKFILFSVHIIIVLFNRLGALVISFWKWNIRVIQCTPIISGHCLLSLIILLKICKSTCCRQKHISCYSRNYNRTLIINKLKFSFPFRGVRTNSFFLTQISYPENHDSKC